jgi:DNA polymerase-3 subunit beta
VKIIAERSAILGALSFVANYIDPSDRIPILAMVRFSAGDTGVTVTATDCEKAASDVFAAHVQAPGSTCLPGAMLAKAIRSTDAAEVQIDAGDKEAVIQIGGRLRMKLPVLPAKDFPDMPMLSADGDCQFTIPADALSRHKREVSFAEGKGSAPHWQHGTLWESTGETLQLCALDGVVLSRITIPVRVQDLPRVTVPATDLPNWEGEVQIDVSESFMRFSCGKQAVATKLLDAPFPEYQQIIPAHTSALRFDRSELFAAFNRMAILPSKGGVSVLIVGRDGSASIMVKSYDGREITDSVPYEGDDFQIAMQQRAMADVLGSMDCEIVEIMIGDHMQNITIHDRRDDSRVMLIAPYRDPRLAEYLPKQDIAA